MHIDQIVYSTQEAAKMLGISVSSIRRLVSNGKLDGQLITPRALAISHTEKFQIMLKAARLKRIKKAA